MESNIETKFQKIPKLENFIKAFSAFITFLISLIIIKNTLYYSSFQITFTDYIDFSEALLLFFDDIIISIFFLVYLVLFALSVPYEQFDVTNLKKKKIIFSMSQEGMICFLFLLLTAIILIIYLIYSRGFNWPNAVAISLSQLVFILGIYYPLRKSVSKKYPEYDLNKLLRYVWPLIALVFYSLFSLHLETRKVLHKSVKTRISCVQYDNQTINSGRDTLYLGRTKNYIFLYSYLEKKALIFHAKDFKRIEFNKAE